MSPAALGPRIQAISWGQGSTYVIGSPTWDAIADDATDGYLVRFGGFGNSTVGQPNTWTFSGGYWTNITARQGVSPPVCEYCGMTFDAATDQVVLLDNGTWVFQAGRWSEAFPSNSPPVGLQEEAMAYDPGDQQVVVFGGRYYDGSCSCEATTGATWALRGTEWYNLTSSVGTAPSPRRFTTLSYDTSDHYDLLFGGFDDVSMMLEGDTWTFSSDHWTQLPAGGPPLRDMALMADDVHDGYVLLYGGVGCSAPAFLCNDTWEYHNGVWTQMFPTPSPGSALPNSEVMTYDPQLGYVIFQQAGGKDNLASQYSWPAPLASALTAQPSSVDVGQTLQLLDSSQGGSPPLTTHWTALPAGCTDSGTASVSCSPSGSGWTNVSATVTDGSGRQLTSTIPFHVWNDPVANMPVPSVPSADVGRPVNFTDPLVGGSGGWIYAWSGPQWMHCGSSTVTVYTCVPYASGVAKISVQVTDSNGYSATSPTMSFVVNTPPSVSLTENRSLMDLGESISFTATASGGTGVYTYAYNGLPSGCSSKNTSVLSCSPIIQGTFTVWAFVNDTNNVMAESSGVSFLVDTAPTISIWFDQGSNFTYANATWDVVLNVTGGSPNYRECDATQQIGMGTICLTGSGISLHFSLPYNLAGTYHAIFSAQDATGWNATIPVLFQVFYPPILSSVTSPSADEGSKTLLVATQWHGAPLVTSWWNDSTSGGSLCGPTATLPGTRLACVLTPLWVGTHTLNLTFRDGLGIQRSVLFPLTVDPAPNLSLRNSPVVIPVGFWFNITSVVSGGAPPYRLCAEVTGSSGYVRCAPRSSFGQATFEFRGPTAQTMLIGFTENDSAGTNRTVWTNVTIAPALGSLTISSPWWGYTGLNSTENLSFSGGALPYTLWVNDTTANLPVCLASSLANGYVELCRFQVTWTGNHTLVATLRDAYGETATATTHLFGLAPPSVSSATAATGSTQVTSSQVLPSETGAPVFLNATFGGGKGMLHYSWWIGSALLSSFNGTGGQWDALWVPTSPGTYLALFDVWDSGGAVTSVSLTVQVVSGLSSPVLVASSDPVDAGTSVALDLTFQHGVAPFEYSWALEGSSGAWTYASTSSPTYAKSWAAAGTYEVEVTVYDRDHAIREAFTNVTVAPGPSVPCSPSLSSNHLTTGSTLNFTLACASGGVTPYVYTWSWGDGSNLSSTLPNASHIFAGAGNYTVNVEVWDTFRLHAWSLPLSVSVRPVPSGRSAGGPSGGTPWYDSWVLPLDLGLGVVAIFLLLLVLRTRRPRSPRPGSGGGTGSTPGRSEGAESNGPVLEESTLEQSPPEGSAVTESDLRRSAEVDAAILAEMKDRPATSVGELRAVMAPDDLSDAELLEHLFAMKKAGRIVMLEQSEEADSPLFALPASEGTSKAAAGVSPEVDESVLNDYLSRRESSLSEDPSPAGQADTRT